MLCRQTNRCLTVLAPAKLNLFLRIVARRSDGYHDIESVMTAVGLYDTLTFEPDSSGDVTLAVVDSSARSRVGCMPLEAPVGSQNLVIRAANLLKSRAGCGLGARIILTKRIPSSAGLGGGSSDCAASLSGLNRLWNLGMSQSDLMEIGGELGSDVPFFVSSSSTAICTGRGEQIEPLKVSAQMYFVIAKPVSGLSTPAVYRRCQPDDSGHHVGAFIDSLTSGSVRGVAQRMHNGLQAPAEELSSDVQRLRRLFETLPVVGHQMSGSGSSYFGICRSRRVAIGVASRLSSAGVPWVRVARCCP